MSTFASIPIVSANPTSGTIETFADGNSNVEVHTDNQSTSTVNLSVGRNTTINSSSFHLNYDSADPSPGSLTLDVDSDGQFEWHLGGNGDGQVGEQNEFNGGTASTSTTANGNQTWLQTGGWRLPKSALMASSDITVELMPDLGAQFSGIGAVTDLTVGDMDGDGLEDPIYLVPDHLGSNGTIWPHIGWLKWSGSSIVTSWIPTCYDADRLIVGDSDNDSSTDVLVVAEDENMLCQHLSGNGWSYSTNVTMNEKFEDALLADMDGDGQDDIVSIDADGTLGMRSFSGGVFTTAVTATVSSGNQIPGLENFAHVGIGSFYGGNQTVIVGETDMMTSYNTLWNFSSNSWFASMQDFECSSGPFEIFDWNADGYQDLMGPTSSAACMATWNGTAWNIVNSNMVGLTNYSIGDHDGDGSIDVFRAFEGAPDGSDSTQTGSLEMNSFNSDGTVNSTSTTFTPHTSPRDIVFADLDGDGLSEQIVAAGEATAGLFIGAWHTLEWDLEGDSTMEMSMAGYASSSNPLSQSDQGLLITNVVTELANVATNYDYYDTPWGTLDPVARSIGAGTITQSALNMSYAATFVVETNPTNGNLSNVLNTFMELGTGMMEIPVNITCTQNGTVTLDSLSIDWTAGASNIQVPPAPNLWVYGFNYSQVSVMWSNTTGLQSDFITYQLFRAPTGTQISITQPLVETIVNGHQDTDGVTNQEWDYAVRSVHQYGIVSNLSNIISVNVPDVPPVYDTTPPDAAIVSLDDVPNDNGGVLNLSFTPSPSNDLAYTLFFVENADFSNATGLTPYANISSGDPTTSMLLSGLTDGENHWAAAVTVDGDDNAWWNVTATGPVHSTNDTTRQSTLTLDVTGDGTYDDGTHSGVHLHDGSSFSINVQLSSEGAPLSDESVALTVTVDGESWSTNVSTGLTGIATESWADWTDFVDQWQAHGGSGQVSASWAGGSYGAAGQSVVSASSSTDIVVTVDAALSTNTPTIQLDAEGLGSAHASAVTSSVAEQDLLSGLNVDWQLGNGTEVFGESGMAQFDSAGTLSIPVNYPTGGWLDVTPTTPWWLTMSPSTLRVDLHPPPQVGCTDANANNFDPLAQVDDNSCTYDTPQLIFVEITCDPSWDIRDNSTQAMADLDANSMHCTLMNNNNVSIFVNIAFTYSENLPLFVDNIASSEVVIDSGESLAFTLSPNAWSEGIVPLNGTVTVDIDLTANGWLGVSDYTLLPYGFVSVNQTIDDSTDNNGNNQGEADGTEEGSNLMLLIAVAVVVLALLGFVGLRMAMREEEDEDAEDFEDEEWQPKPKKRVRTQPDMEDMPTGRSLDELTTKASTVSMTKPRKVDRRAGSRPAPVAEVVEEEYEEEAEWDYTQDEDYHVDEEGVEWWKDEVGQWWYKYPEDEDWEAFEE
ncbi:MAG: hypothetical protein P8Q90_05050 [Candidatus Thalassarchaeaceae archaeon]|nr:hypothetical protein [Candidatus Thalassarchaeaceae archaeon]